MVEASDIEAVLALGHEIETCEIKGPMSLADKPFRARVVRAAMAMGNHRDGGWVVIGIDEGRFKEMRPGLTPAQLAEWSDPDQVTDALAPYVDPTLEFRTVPLRLASGADVVVIEVDEFRDVPHICAREYQAPSSGGRPGKHILKQGSIYVRPRGLLKSVPIPDQSEMRDLIELATEKAFRRTLRVAGGAISAPQVPLAEEDYWRDRQAAWGQHRTPRIDYVESLGHWDLTIRPAGRHDDNRLSYARLRAYVETKAVRLRGWPLPYINDREPLIQGHDWVGQDHEPRSVPHAESWRMTTSGMFLQRRVLKADLANQPGWVPTAPGADSLIQVWEVLFYATEAVELAARMATAADGPKSVVITMGLQGTSARQLVSGNFNRELDHAYVAQVDEMTSERTLTQTDLARDARGIAVCMSQDFLTRFGLDVPDEVLDDWQREIAGGSDLR